MVLPGQTLNVFLIKIISECNEIKQALAEHESQKRRQEEIGDLIHAAFSLCVFLDCDLEETIERGLHFLTCFV